MNNFRRISVTAGIAAAVLLGVTQTATAVPAPAAPAPVAVPTPAPLTGGALALSGTGSTANTPTDQGSVGSAQTAAALGLCFFTTNGDFVHVSSSAFEASGHGWWVNGNCPTSTAVVTVQLQELYSDGSWRNKGVVGRSTVRSGGGAGNRATGRAGCNSSRVVGWRSVIDVDLVGVADSPDKLVTPARNIPCVRL